MEGKRLVVGRIVKDMDSHYLLMLKANNIYSYGKKEQKNKRKRSTKSSNNDTAPTHMTYLQILSLSNLID